MDQPPDVIALQNLLKLSGMVASGGEAKVRIQAGEVLVNGSVETRRRRKLHEGDTVVLGDQTVVVTFDDEDSDDDGSGDEEPGPDVSAPDPRQMPAIDPLEIDTLEIDPAEPDNVEIDFAEAADGDGPDGTEDEG